MVAPLRVRIEPGVPKLLVKINPAEAEGLSAQNLGEVTLRKATGFRSQVAVLHVNRSVTQGEILMSMKLADLLDAEEGEKIEVASNAKLGAGMPMERPEAPLHGRASMPAGLGQSHLWEPHQPDSPAVPRPDARPSHRGSRAPHPEVPPLTRAGRPLFSEDDWLRRPEKAHDGAFASGLHSSGHPSNPASRSTGSWRHWQPGDEAGQHLGGHHHGGALGPQSSRFFRDAHRSTDGTDHTAAFTHRPLGRPSFDWADPGCPGDHLEGGRPVPGRLRSSSFSSNYGAGVAGGGGHAARTSFEHRWAGASAGEATFSARGRYGTEEAAHTGAAVTSTVRYPGHISRDIDRQGRSGYTGTWPDRGDRLSCSCPLVPPASWEQPPGVAAARPGAGEAAPTMPLDGRGAEAPSVAELGGPLWDSALPGTAAPHPAEVLPEAMRHSTWLPSERSSAGWSSSPPGSKASSGARAPESQRGGPGAAAGVPPLPRGGSATAAGSAEDRRGRFLEPSHSETATAAAKGVPIGNIAWANRADPWAGLPARGAPQQPQQPAPPAAPGPAEPEGPASQAESHGSSGSESSSRSSSPPCQRDSSAGVWPSYAEGIAGAWGRSATSDKKDALLFGASSRVGSSSRPTSASRQSESEEGGGPSQQASSSDTEALPPLPQRRTTHGAAHAEEAMLPPLALVPCRTPTAAATHFTNCAGGGTTPASRRSGLLWKRRSITLGALQPEPPPQPAAEPRQPVPSRWRPPLESSSGLERSELGPEATTELRRWLIGETSGAQCSQVILDRALTVLSNFKLASGCQLEVLGGPLGALVGGYNDADWLHDEVFKKQPGEAVQEAFTFLGFRARGDGDYSNVSMEEVSLVYRRMCLRGHPSRGGMPRSYLKLQIAMELIRAFSGEAGPLVPVPCELGDGGFTLTDLALARELQLSAQEAEEEAARLPQEHLEEINRALDEYILRQMCFKSEIVDEIARLHEDSAYAILGVSSDATDAEIKKAYRLIAMQCHPDKGGDKEDFQELNNAYEKIMEQRRASGGGDAKAGAEADEAPEGSADGEERGSGRSKGQGEAAEAEGEEGDAGRDETNASSKEASAEEEAAEVPPHAEGASNECIVDKAAKAAEEASRYAKTAAEFAQQAAQAAEEARKEKERGSRDSMTKSIAHSAIVCTLTVVKAVRAVGYASLDVAAQCRIAAKRNPLAVDCAEHAVSAMSLGLDALNAALVCAEATETTAAQLQKHDPASDVAGGPEASERFVGAAVKASLAAASASNAAMSAAIAAVEGSRQCAAALASAPDEAGTGKVDGEAEEGHGDGAGGLGDEEDAEESTTDAGDADQFAQPSRRPPPSAAEVAAIAAKRLVTQRHNNHKVLRRLNAEILGHQRNVRQFLQENRQLIPAVSGEAKQKIFALLRDYAAEARLELGRLLQPESGPVDAGRLLAAVRELPLFVPFLQPQTPLAIPVCVKTRVLKMATLYDAQLTMRVLEEEVFGAVRMRLPSGSDSAKRADELFSSVAQELCCNVAEAGGQTPASCGDQTPSCSRSNSKTCCSSPSRFGV